MLLVVLLACKGGDEGETGCDQQYGTIYGTVELWDETVELAQVYARQEQLQPIQARADADGVYVLELQAGPWLVRAEDPGGWCPSDEVEVAITTCGEHQQDFVLPEDCAMPGR